MYKAIMAYNKGDNLTTKPILRTQKMKILKTLTATKLIDRKTVKKGNNLPLKMNQVDQGVVDHVNRSQQNNKNMSAIQTERTRTKKKSSRKMKRQMQWAYNIMDIHITRGING